MKVAIVVHAEAESCDRRCFPGNQSIVYILVVCKTNGLLKTYIVVPRKPIQESYNAILVSGTLLETYEIYFTEHKLCAKAFLYL